MAETEGSSQRALAEIIVKLVTVHIVTAANYHYLCSIQGCNDKTRPTVTRFVFFVFTPTLLFLDTAISLLRAVVNFIQDEADDAQTSFGFFSSAALGVQAIQKKRDGVDDGKEAPKRISLLDLSCGKCDQEHMPIEWTWAGKVLISVFTLVQGIGTIIVWVQRLIDSGTLGFDDRIGIMGIATTVLSVNSLMILIIRSRWTVSQPLPVFTGDSDRRHSPAFTISAFVALMLQDFTRSCSYRRDATCLVPNPSFFLLSWALPDDFDFKLWPLIVLAIFVLVFRIEIAQKINLTGLLKIQSKFFTGGRIFSRLKVLAHICFILFLASDVIVKLVNDIVQIVALAHAERDGYTENFWRQSPLSEAIPVL